MAENFRMIFLRFWKESPRDLSSVKGHAVYGIEELLVFIGILGRSDLQVTKIVTAMQTQFGGADCGEGLRSAAQPTPGQ